MEMKEDIACKLLCMSCLCFGRTLKPVTEEKLKKYYVDILNEIPLYDTQITCPNLCIDCRALLKKAVSFKEQVQDSFRVLQTYTNESLNECLLTEVTRQPRLRVHHVDPISISPIEDECTDIHDVQLVCVKDEVKKEWNDKDLEDTVHSECPLSETEDIKDIDAELETLLRTVKKDKKRKRKEDSKERKARKIVKSLQVNSNKELNNSKGTNDQKIITIELTYEEMLLERDSESKRESYVRSEYKCESCLVGFNYSKSYKRHVTSKHSPELGDYSCPICKTVIASVESFTAHYKRHMRRYECSICQKRTQDMKVMQQHYFSTHDISLKRYKCDLCGKLSNSIDTHRYHKDTHKARVQCSECDKTFTHRAGLMNHRLAVHEFHNAFPCTVCDKVFRWKTSLKRHLEKHAAEGKSTTAAAFCSTCGVSFSSVCSYQRHMKNSLKHVSHEQLRFICDHCNRRFADKTKLRDHIEEKHLHKTYQCHICLKPSKNRMGLDQHIRNVHRGRPNNKICHHCGKGFPTKVQLESHIRTHTGERPFICEYCPTTFSQQSNLYKHNRQVHLNIKSKRYSVCKKKQDVSAEPLPPQTQPDPYKPVAVLHYTLPDRGFLI
ncbi:zinc finger protein 782-like isoform X1 [Galleria mellonella]|uniref:Zinc finger protein 782-like isoform X1 n=1 Tax=Galleria mellonella TaxID=7137 RepID=A0ABM3M9Y2_GALME|nr:zinc finger protein 782-like isoform X1 [Galleria mellonella]